MGEVVVGLESILTLQEKTDNTLLTKLFGRRVPTNHIPSNWDNFVLGTDLKSLDIYLYTVGGEDRIVHQFDFNTIVYATKNFSEANKLWSDYRRLMYKGRLQNGQDIIVSQYMPDRIYRGPMNEASILVKLEHENVIQLLGYCIDGTNVYLLYDGAFYATLAGLIFDPVCNLLDWNKRYNIILGVARALVYLHNHAPIQIIHSNVKAANILLDESFNPNLSDFRLATALNGTDGVYVAQVCGTIGYMVPEYIFRCILSTKADVYSFGMLVLETVIGQGMYDFEEFYDYVARNWLEGTLSNIIDCRIDVDAILMTKLVEIGLLCIQIEPTNRPTMKKVVDMLLDTSSISLPVSEMRARMIGKPSFSDSPVIEDYDTTAVEAFDYDTAAVEAFVSELFPR